MLISYNVKNAQFDMFKKWIMSFWPIYKQEIKQVLLLCLLRFLLFYVYGVLTVLKSTTLIMASHSAAEVVFVVKGAMVLPMSIGVFIIYTHLSRYIKQSTIFYSTVGFFLGFLWLYGFVLYPNEAKISPNLLADILTAYWGESHMHWIALLRHWIHGLFFVVAELWGQLVVTVLYWNLVNNVCTVLQAKRVYALFIASGHLGLSLSGLSVIYYTKNYGKDLLFMLQSLFIQCTVFGIISIFLYWWVNRLVHQHSLGACAFDSVPQKLMLSFWASLRQVALSSYLRNMAIMMVACNFSLYLLDGTWRSYLRANAIQSADYQYCTALVVFWIGLVSFVCASCFSGTIIRKFGWKLTARIAPTVIGIMGCIFFFISYAKSNIPFVSDCLGPNIGWYLVVLGGLQTIVGQVVKFTFYEKAEQIAYIPLEPEAKVTGKAAVDMVGSRFGKALSSWVHLMALECFHTSNIQTCSGVLVLILCIVIIFWYRAIDHVDKKLATLEM